MLLGLLFILCFSSLVAALEPPYTIQGTIDIITDENSLFYWQGTMYNLENVACAYYNHAGIWNPDEFGNMSYASIRNLETGMRFFIPTSTSQTKRICIMYIIFIYRQYCS